MIKVGREWSDGDVVRLMLQEAVSDLCKIDARSEAFSKAFVFEMVNRVIVITWTTLTAHNIFSSQ